MDGLLAKAISLNIFLLVGISFSKKPQKDSVNDDFIDSLILSKVYNSKIYKKIKKSELVKNKLFSVLVFFVLISVLLTPIITSEDLVNTGSELVLVPEVIENEVLTDDGFYSKFVTFKNSDLLDNSSFVFDIPEVRYDEQIELYNLNNLGKNEFNDYDIFDSDSDGLFDKISFDCFSSFDDVNYEIFIDTSMVSFVDNSTDVIDNYDGTHTAVIYTYPVNYYNSTKGCFKPIDTSIKNSNVDGFIFENVENVFNSFFDESGLVCFEKNGRYGFSFPVNQSFGNLQNPFVKINGSCIVYYDIYDGVDLRYTVFNDKVLEEYVFDSFINFSHLDSGLGFSGVYPVFNNNSLVFYDNISNDSLFGIPEPVMWEEDDVSERNYGLKYEIFEENGNSFLRKILTDEGKNWLNDESRSFPVVIDATWSDDSPVVDGYVSFVDPPKSYTRYDARNTLEWCYFNYFGTTFSNRSYVEWNINPISGEGYEITNVDFAYHGVSNQISAKAIYSMENQPSSLISPQTLYNDCVDGTVYTTNSSFPVAQPDQKINLGDGAVSNLWNACNSSQRWWAIGISPTVGSIGTPIDMIYSSDFSKAKPPPILSVTYQLPSNNPPSVDGERPLNQSTNIEILPTLNVTISDSDSVYCNVTWRSNSGGTWADFGYNNSLGVGEAPYNISQINVNFSEYSTKYYWSINCSDGTGWTNKTFSFITENPPSSSPVINSYDLLNSTGSKLNNATGLLDYNKEYIFTVNVTDSAGWSDIDYINITGFYDNNSEITVYNQTSGGNINFFLQYKNTTGTADFNLIWPDDEIILVTDNCTEKIVDSNTHIVNFSFKPKNQIRWANGDGSWDTSTNTTTDSDSWNFNINVTDNSELKAWIKDEFGVYRYTSITPTIDSLSVKVAPGFGENSNVLTVNYSSNYDFILTVYFEKNLTNSTSGESVAIKDNVYVLADADSNDDITIDTAFQGIGVDNEIEIFNSSGVFSNDDPVESVQIQFKIFVPMGMTSGIYTTRIATTITQK